MPTSDDSARKKSPAASAGTKPAKGASETASPADAVPIRAAPWSILIVDDSSSFRTQLAAAFEARGARVLQAESGTEGLWRAREHTADLILTDIHMPGMDGFRLIQEIRKLRQYERTPI